MSLRVSQIWITLGFKQRFRETAIRLIYPRQLCLLWKNALAHFESDTLFSRRHFNSPTTEDLQKRLGIWRRLDEKSEKLRGLARPYCFFPDRIETSQPLFAICRCVVQQKKCRRRHVF